jgi:uncharacterized membrane protein
MKKCLLTNIPFWLPITLGIVALCGFIDAAYLTIEHYANTIPPCVVGNCELVLTSKFATVAGIPVALLGTLYYLAILVLVIGYFESKKEVLLRTAMFATTLGLLASIWFFVLQAFVLHAFCQFCLISATTSTALFVIAGIGFKKYSKAPVVQ